jgi:hypothetical protein
VHGPSQYPHENECLFAPLTGIEVQGTRIEGAVLVIEARLSVNLNALTIEQVPSVGVCVQARVAACCHVQSRIMRCERVLLAVVQVVSKRRKVVEDMVSNVLVDFGPGLEQEAWTALGPSALGDAGEYLKGLLKPLHSEEPEYYNEDAQLGAAINAAVFRASAVRGWGEGAAALASVSGHEAAALLELETLDLTGKVTNETVWNGIGALLGLGRLQVLQLDGASLGAAGAKRLAVELGTAPHLTELRCAPLPGI